MNHSFSFERDGDTKEMSGGTLFRVTKDLFPILSSVALNAIRLKPGAIREPHIHPNCAQLDYCVSGSARVGIIGPKNERHILDIGLEK